ncbi:MAG: hypothetical protein CL472_04215 [Acidobacteria bacterium]|nr:hypothetical protein [Acidobacteriota bacterium]
MHTGKNEGVRVQKVRDDIEDSASESHAGLYPVIAHLSFQRSRQWSLSEQVHRYVKAFGHDAQGSKQRRQSLLQNMTPDVDQTQGPGPFGAL